MARDSNFVGHGSGGTNVVLDQIALEPNRRSSHQADDTTQGLHVALHSTDGLDDPDEAGDLDGELTDLVRWRKGICFGCGAEDFLDQGRVVARRLQPREVDVEACANEVELEVRGRGTNSLDRVQLRGEEQYGLDGIRTVGSWNEEVEM